MQQDDFVDMLTYDHMTWHDFMEYHNSFAWWQPTGASANRHDYICLKPVYVTDLKCLLRVNDRFAYVYSSERGWLPEIAGVVYDNC